MTLSEIRSKFFTYFESQGHKIVPSAPMVVKNDPTLMFINAGMNQFKDAFLGNAAPPFKRVANTQKCLRVSGKHNDLEEVGVDTYHHTMFEMLGNWSFGDYFKEDTIKWSWELLTEVYKLPKDRLYVTIFEGDETDGVPLDTESLNVWKKYIPEDRIIPADKVDNFWEMGETGPCGPCSEIHIDLRSEEDRAKVDGKSLVNMDHPQVIEVWNNVFMEFNRKADKSLEPLPEKHVDTGMGLERLAMALQGKQSNYDTDLFQTLIKHMEKVSGKEYGKDETIDIALRVIADHVRAIAFSIADGQLPSNTGSGYVIRRILRRAVRYGYQTLGLKSSFLADLSTTLTEIMSDPFMELKQQQTLIHKVIKEEETSFFRTLEQGLRRMDLVINKTKLAKQSTIEGFIVFELYDTYGFPLDLTSLIARENGLEVDEVGFNRELELQKTRSRAATAMETDDWIVLCDDNVEEFVGYDLLETHVKIVKYRKVVQKKKEFYQVVFNLTTFYPEGGGQVGDTGHIEYSDEKAYIFDTKKENGLIVHYMKELPESLKANFLAVVNKSKRSASANNHSATHLLHHALRTVLGDHVEQKGSLVNSDYLRFDFSHFSKVTDEELAKIQQVVSESIRTNHTLEEKRNTPMEIAQEMGAMALFGEKYGDTVRVIKFGDSVELCGGTHVQSTGEIGLFKITSEAAVAAGVRRIEAITSRNAESYYADKADKLDTISCALKNPKDIEKAVNDLLTRNSTLMKTVEKLQREKALSVKGDLKNQIVDLNGTNFLSAIIDLDGGSIKDILFQLKGEVENFAGVIGGKADGKCTLSLIASDNIVSEKEINAGAIIREVSIHIQGGGGGQPNFATAGGKNASGLEKAITEVKAKF
ncbi:MAG: alanine--tRNA ligase [Crocinitomicaceae bacterium]|nr:alanine--tRNA ligase [Crocinitomicaceae bacterium]MDG1658892.1 alanine--tRNA ligase [Crocinitomicaceae bacterium]